LSLLRYFNRLYL